MNCACNHWKYVYSYSLQMTANVLTTVQFETSNPDVMIRLSILDKEKEVAVKTGKGHVVIPAFNFLVNKGTQQSHLVRQVKIRKYNFSNFYSLSFLSPMSEREILSNLAEMST